MLRIPDDRHPGTQHFRTFFDFEHLPPLLAEVAATFAIAAQASIDALHDGPELSAALRKLVEAKDCAVRQRRIDMGGPMEPHQPDPTALTGQEKKAAYFQDRRERSARGEHVGPADWYEIDGERVTSAQYEREMARRTGGFIPPHNPGGLPPTSETGG